MAKTGKTNADRLRSMVDGERLRYDDAIDILRTDWEDVRTWADHLAAIADYIEEAADEIEGWHDEEDREARADAKENALISLDNLLSEIMGLDELNPLPDLTETPYVEEAS